MGDFWCSVPKKFHIQMLAKIKPGLKLEAQLIDKWSMGSCRSIRGSCGSIAGSCRLAAGSCRSIVGSCRSIASIMHMRIAT